MSKVIGDTTHHGSIIFENAKKPHRDVGGSHHDLIKEIKEGIVLYRRGIKTHSARSFSSAEHADDSQSRLEEPVTQLALLILAKRWFW